MWIVMKQVHSRSYSHMRLLQDPTLLQKYIEQHDAICRSRASLGERFGEDSIHDCLEGTIANDTPTPEMKELVLRDYHNVMHSLRIDQRVRAYRTIIHRLVLSQDIEQARLAVRLMGAPVRLKVASRNPAEILSDNSQINDSFIQRLAKLREQGFNEQALEEEKHDFDGRHTFITGSFRPLMQDGHIGHIVIGGGHSKHGSGIRTDLGGLHLENYLEREGGSIVVWESPDYAYLHDRV